MNDVLVRARGLTEGFFAWWFGELKALLPPRLMRLLVPPVNELEMERTGPRLVLRRRTGEAERDLGTIGIDGVDPEEAKAALRPLLRDLDLAYMLVSLRLPDELALRKVVELPAAAEENLRQVMAFEMDRMTPFPAEAVHYDVHVLERDREARRIKVELLVLPRAAVAASVASLQTLGITPDVFALPRGRSGGQPWRIPLATNGAARRGSIGRLTMALLLLAMGLLVATIVIAFDRQERRAEVLEREVAATRKEAEEGRQLQAEIERLGSEGNFIVEKKRGRPAVVVVLDELTRALPDDTWLYRLRLQNEELQTFGYSPNASAMIGHIENAPLFSSAQFRAPLTRDQRIDAEQFHVAFQVKPEESR